MDIQQEEISLLFITRNFPPTIGGLEKYSHDLYVHLQKKIPQIFLLANKNHLRSLPFFFIRTLYHLFFSARKFSNIHLTDASLSLFIPIIKIFAPRCRVTISIHGLDIVYENTIYQLFIPKLVSMADAIICVSSNTKEQCCLRNIPESKCHVIPNGIDFGHENIEKMDIAEAERIFDIKISGKRVAFSIGRLIKRKGITWFIKNVMTKVGDQTIYLVAGTGPEQDSIKKTIEQFKLEQKVFLLGKVSEQQKNSLFRMADFFIMPNIRTKNDIEGFGLTVLEAGKYGVTVIATGVEGLLDSVVDGKNGFLVEEKNRCGFLKYLSKEPLDRKSVWQETEARFNWQRIVFLYYDIISGKVHHCKVS